MREPIRRRVSIVLRVLALLAVLLATAANDGCESTTYVGVGVSYGYPGWGGPCCYGPGVGWGTGVYMGGPVW
jgi:hypothetical protein